MNSILLLYFLLNCVLSRDSNPSYFPKWKAGLKNGNDITFSFTNIEFFCKLEDNKNNPKCLRDRSNSITNLMETDMPEIITKIQSEGKDFASLGLEEQLKKLESYEKEIKVSEKGELVKLVEKLIEYSYYLSLIDCSIIYSNQPEFSNCRKNKRKLLVIIYQIIINKFKQSKEVDYFLEKGISNNIEENFKYLLWLLNTFTLNSDSFPIGKTQDIYYLIFRTEDSFLLYLLNLERDLHKKETDNSKIFSVKKDVSILFAKIMSNLINIFYYDEYDGVIKTKKKKTGILDYKNGVILHKYIMGFIPVFNQFGEGEYKISDKLSFFIKKYHVDNETIQLQNVRQLKAEKENDEQAIYSFPDKRINVILNPKKIFQKIISKLNETKESYQTKQIVHSNQTEQINLKEISIQIVNFESPLVPIKRDKEEVTIRHFVDISLYYKTFIKINLSSLIEDEKPIILYNTEYYPNLKHCFYFNEDSVDLDTQGVETEFNFNFNGSNYLKCSSEHLTSFTAGDYITNLNNGFYISPKVQRIIVYIIIIVIIIFAIITIYKTIKKISSNNKEKIGKTSGTLKSEEKKENNKEENKLDNF